MQLKEIQKRISENISDPDNYLNLADFYLDINPNLAYLSLENAFFYEKDNLRKNQIRQMVEELGKEDIISVKPVTVIVRDLKSIQNIDECIESIHNTCCTGSYEIVKESENSGTALGNDILFINADTMLLPNSLYCMRMALYSDDNIGAVGPMGSNVPNGQQINGLEKIDDCYIYSVHNNIPFDKTYESCTWLVGFALLIRHDVREKVGFLDERFSPGCYEDNDYCYRILEAGYKNILCHNCVIYHYGSKGFEHEKKINDDGSRLLFENYRKLNDKWEMNIVYRLHQRREVIRLIERDHPDHNDTLKVIEWNKDRGTALFGVKSVFGNAEVYDNDSNGELADYIILEETLECVKDPYAFLRRCNSYLKKDGQIIAVISNMMHFSVMIPLLKGNYDFDKDGISNYTHLHNFTKSNIAEMFRECGYKLRNIFDFVIGEEAISDDISSSDMMWFLDLINGIEKAPEDQFFAYKYLIIANRK